MFSQTFLHFLFIVCVYRPCFITTTITICRDILHHSRTFCAPIFCTAANCFTALATLWLTLPQVHSPFHKAPPPEYPAGGVL